MNTILASRCLRAAFSGVRHVPRCWRDPRRLRRHGYLAEERCDSLHRLAPRAAARSEALPAPHETGRYSLDSQRPLRGCKPGGCTALARVVRRAAARRIAERRNDPIPRPALRSRYLPGSSRLETPRLCARGPGGLAGFAKPSPAGISRLRLRAAGRRLRCCRSPAKRGLHRGLLLCKWRALSYRSRRHPAEEPLVTGFTARNRGGRNGPFTETQIAGGRSDGHAAAHHGNLCQLGAVHCNLIAEHAPLEILRGDSGHAVYTEPGIPVRAHEVRVANNVDVVDEPGPPNSKTAAAIPGVKHFKRSQRDPSHISETETDAESRTAESEEADQRRMPPVAAIPRAGEPTPAETGTEVPRTVVKRCPAPRFVVHPSPAIIVFPNPLAIAVRSPGGRDVRCPDIAVSRVISPAAVCIEIFRPLDVLAYVTIGLRPLEKAVALVVEVVPAIPRRGRYNLVFGIVGCSAHQHHTAFVDTLSAARRGNFRVAPADHDSSRAIYRHFHSNRGLPKRMNCHGRRADLGLDIGILGVAQHAPRNQSLRYLNLNAAVVELGDADLGIPADP